MSVLQAAMDLAGFEDPVKHKASIFVDGGACAQVDMTVAIGGLLYRVEVGRVWELYDGGRRTHNMGCCDGV